MFALLIAVIAAGAAAYAVQLAQEVRDENAGAAAGVAETPTPGASDVAGDDAPAADASPTPTAAPTQSTAAGVQYTPELTRAEVRIPNPAGCTAGYVDVDTANVGVDAGHEFYFSRCQDPALLQVRVDRTSGRSTSSANPSPQACGSLVAGTPSSELILAAEDGLTFCLLTNRAQATAAGLPQRLAIIEVITVTTAEIRIALSTFRVD